jgi:hypothetical protein
MLRVRHTFPTIVGRLLLCVRIHTVENNHSRKLTRITLLNKSVPVGCGTSRGGAIDLAVSMFLYHTFPTIVMRLLVHPYSVGVENNHSRKLTRITLLNKSVPVGCHVEG